VASERSPEARLPGGDTSVDGLALRSSVYADPELRSDRTTVRRVPDEQRVRRSARVLLVDWADRLLLVRLAAPVDGLPLWIAPGGGIEAGEDSLDAAVRELREELGIRLDPEQLTGPVWVQELDIGFGPYTGIENTYLFARADVVPDLSTTAAEWATEGIVEVDTWDTERMRAAAGRALFSPRALPDMLDAVLANALPNPPLSVGL
jgi:8-oxo-dGTP diphosphatase